MSIAQCYPKLVPLFGQSSSVGCYEKCFERSLVTKEKEPLLKLLDLCRHMPKVGHLQREVRREPRLHDRCRLQGEKRLDQMTSPINHNLDVTGQLCT